jgi:hypothetical protein
VHIGNFGTRVGCRSYILGAAAALTRLIGTLPYKVSPRDPLAFATAFVVMTIAALAACFLPAWRATRTDQPAHYAIKFQTWRTLLACRIETRLDACPEGYALKSSIEKVSLQHARVHTPVMTSRPAGAHFTPSD